jgi:hypothetical protein
MGRKEMGNGNENVTTSVKRGATGGSNEIYFD